MITRFAAIVLLCVFLVACKTDDAIQYKNVYVPVYVVPAPPKVQRPELEIDKLTEDEKKDAGLVLRAHNASDQQILGYVSQLEKIVQRYAGLAEDSERNLSILSGNNAPLKLDDKSDAEWKDTLRQPPKKSDE